jgi:predicted double-glycine peptidase
MMLSRKPIEQSFLAGVIINRVLNLAIIAASVAITSVTLAACGSVEPTTDPPPVTSLLEVRQHGVAIQKWDLSCGAAALDILLQYEWGDPVTEREIALGLMKRKEYIDNPDLVRIREGFSLLDLKRYAETRGYRGVGLGGLDLNDLITNAPIMVPVNALGYNHFVVFRGMYGNRVLLADPGWGNRTMTTEKFRNMWLDYGQPIGRVGFVVQRTDGHPRLNTLSPRLADFVTLN